MHWDIQNLGGILKDLGKLKEAELSTRKAIELNPNYAELHSKSWRNIKRSWKIKGSRIIYS